MSDRPTGWEGAERWFSTGRGGTGGGEGGPPAPPDPAPEEPPPSPACEVCGAPLEHDQTYCLECGSPTPLAPRLHRGGRAAAILAGAMIVLGLGAGALAFAVVRDDGGGPGSDTIGVPVTTGGATVPLPPETAPTVGTLPADTTFTSPTAPLTTPTTPTATGPATGFDTVTGPSSTPATTTAPATTSAPPTTTSAPPASGDSDWPSGRTAWTAILASVRSESDARAAKSRVAGDGEPAGVLLSTGFPELRPGYWVVFSGTYDSRNTAIAQAVKLRPDFPTAYARHIEG